MTIKLMTWNVENLFRPETGSGSLYKTKLEGLAKGITQLAPTVIAVQEVGSVEALEDLLARLNGTWHYALSQFPDERGIRVGFISRSTLYDPEDIVTLPEQFFALQAGDQKTMATRVKRGSLAVSIKAGGQDIRLVTAHLKSKLVSYPGGRFAPRDENERARYAAYALFRRAAEAVTVRTYCNTYLAGKIESRPLALLGDMNDEPQAATTQILVGPLGSEIGSAGESRPDEGDRHRLFNLAPLLPEHERQTRVYRGRGELIDHIFVSKALLGRLDKSSVHAPRAAELPSIDDSPRPPKDEPSDHAPIVADFIVG